MEEKTAWGSSKTFNYYPQFFWKLLKSPELEIQISSRSLRTNISLVNGLMCLFNVHKIVFQEADCFSCHFAFLKYTTYGKRIEIQGLTKSTAEIISPRGCVWELNERESSYLFISVLSGPLHHNLGKRNCIFGGWKGILLRRLSEVDLLERAWSPQHNNSFWSRKLWKSASAM